jgi:N-acyl-D-amino-acid deacylase
MRKLLTALILFAGTACMAQTSCDILIRNGRIIDGADNSWYYGDVAVGPVRSLPLAGLPITPHQRSSTPIK